jgi:hypothetical protein
VDPTFAAECHYPDGTVVPLEVVEGEVVVDPDTSPRRRINVTVTEEPEE